ncbi:MAG: hypothetical protein GEU75_04130 [Dehalococcoidia bacterium]|nr:hypothetical protein [Dehalococcoidia bacterium]
MPIVWLLEWTGIGPVEYEKLKSEIDWQSAEGLQLHVASFNEKGIILAEVWESPDHVQPFMDDLLLPAVQKLGIQTMPRVDLYETHTMFGPVLKLD